MNITAPGLYFDVPTADYFADPCPAPSLTQSVAKILLEKSPLHAWHAHPRLNPDYRPADDTKFDIGNVAHKMMLGRGKAIEVLDFADWRTKAAQEARAAALAAGKLAVLGKHYARADKMVRAAREQLELCGLDLLFAPDAGHSEVVIAWREGDLWLRSMIDWLGSGNVVADFKTTGLSCAPHVIAERPSEMGWDIQAAMHERGLDAVDPDNAGRRSFIYVVQEDEPPFALTPVEISESDLTLGRKKLARAIELWSECMQANRWPGYPREVVTSTPRPWTETRWLDREVALEESRRTTRGFLGPDHLMAG